MQQNVFQHRQMNVKRSPFYHNTRHNHCEDLLYKPNVYEMQSIKKRGGKVFPMLAALLTAAENTFAALF